MNCPFLIFAALLAFSTPSFAAAPDSKQGDWLTGLSAGKLMGFCQQAIRALDQKSEKTDKEGFATFCMGYVQGFTDGYVMAENSEVTFCIPHGVKANEIVREFVKRAEAMPPERLEETSTLMLTLTMSQAYPCDKINEVTKN